MSLRTTKQLWLEQPVDTATVDSPSKDSGAAAPLGTAEGAATDVASINNAVRDAIDQLPLGMIPIQTKSLRRARLIKNMQLDGVVEIFSDESTGSGQLTPDQLVQYFNWPEKGRHPDMQTIRRLAALNSYDVYSLRIELRRLGIPISEVDTLHLSDAKAQELTQYMKSFTEPLMRQVYGGSDSQVQDFGELIAMFERPNKAEALRNLRKIAEKLQIELLDVPRFLEDYGDVFLSLAYFKEHLDDLVPRISAFLDGAKAMQSNFQLRNDPRFMTSCEYLDERLSAIITSITGRFESFNQHTAHMWHNITADSFRKVRDLITAHHTTVGGVLCGLSVKMRHWDQRFGKVKGEGQILSRSEFITSEMRQGIDRIQKIEASAPKIADLN